MSLRLKLISLFMGAAALLSGWTIASAATEIGEDQYVIFYHNDMLGSPTVVTDHNGNVLWYEHSDPYGRSRNRVSSSKTEFYSDRSGSRKGYTGHVKDDGADLVYMKARYYDPVIGRFYSNDPVGFTLGNPMMFNRYAYANNSPYLYIDPTGKNGVTGIGGVIKESYDAIGSFFEDNLGFGWGDGDADWGSVGDAFADGYDGNLEESLKAGAEDLITVAGGAIVGKVVGKAFGWIGSKFKTAKKGLGGNPFQGKTPQQIDKMFREKGFDVKGTDPVAGKGSYINPKTGRKYYTDKGGKYKKGTEQPHVDVHRPSSSSLPKKKHPLGDRLIE